MPISLAGPLAGRRRFVALAIIITILLLYFAQSTPIAWDAIDADIAGSADNARKAGSATSSPGTKTENPEDYHAHDHHPPHPSKEDVEQAAKESPDDMRWADRPATPSPAAGGADPDSTEATEAAAVTCPASFETFMRSKPGPFSTGKRKFPYIRPPPECRTFNLPSMEALIAKMKTRIADPDLFRLFENSYPNTLDTMVKWRGYATETVEDENGEEMEKETDMELTYVITGDIDAMWLRDSASQIYSYLPLLEADESFDSLAGLWRGLINSHARYIMISPYCHSFQPPPESGIKPTKNGANAVNHPKPGFDPSKVFDCKWELDSLGSFLQISAAYYQKTGDKEFFTKHDDLWVKAVEVAVTAAKAMTLGTYAEDGNVENSAYTFYGQTNRGSETLTNDGLGNPVKENGMVRSSFRPSDDACIFQLLTPANMFWGKGLEEASHVMETIGTEKAKNLTEMIREHAGDIRRGIGRDAVVARHGTEKGKEQLIFAYEVDGYGGANLMDDSNVPSLLALPLFNWTQSSVFASGGTEVMGRSKNGTVAEARKLQRKDGREVEDFMGDHDYAAVYQNTRDFALSMHNPYFMKGPVISAVGGPHLGPGKAWPMAAIVAGMTAYDPISGIEDSAAAAAEQLEMVLDSTAGMGVVHESVSSFNEGTWSRAWFGWANGLFGEFVMRIAENEEDGEGLLGRMWQDGGDGKGVKDVQAVA